MNLHLLLVGSLVFAATALAVPTASAATCGSAGSELEPLACTAADFALCLVEASTPKPSATDGRSCVDRLFY